MSSEAERRWGLSQALANTRLEGHVPTSEFLADCAACVAGEISTEEARARSLTRALKEWAELQPSKPTPP